MSQSENLFRVDRVAVPLRHRVTESIRQAIATGYFKAGDHLPERELCEMTGVSRTLVREAMRQLESEGLIKVEPHRGPFVARLTREQASGVYQVRMELEGLACTLFTQNATEAHREALKQAFDTLKSTAPRSEPRERLQAKNHFYDCLVEGTQNEALGICLYMLNSRITLLRATSMNAPGRVKQSIAELSEILDALMMRDAPRAAELARHHVQMAAKAALDRLAENEKAEAQSK